MYDYQAPKLAHHHVARGFRVLHISGCQQTDFARSKLVWTEGTGPSELDEFLRLDPIRPPPLFAQTAQTVCLSQGRVETVKGQDRAQSLGRRKGSFGLS